MKTQILRAALALAACAVATAGAQAQEFPSRPIKWIVPYLAGTGPDTTVRVVAEAMSEILGQPVVVDNKGGAAGNLGAQIAARSAPDGYTWVYSATTMSASMRMYRKPGYDVMKDFTHVGRISQSDVLLVVHPDAGIASTRDLIERARSNPGKLSYASGGVGTPAHLGAELMLNSSGARALHVPYKGASESVNAVLGKQVDFALALASVALPQIQAGKLTALAVTGPRRNPKLPKVPTLAEAGVPNVQLVSFGGLSVPAGTPPAITARIGGALRKALAQPQVRAKLEASGSLVVPSTGEEFAHDLQAEIALTERMMKVVKLDPQ
ncbi:Bug family tripartite tricarboxylate transporter substrate binding protein [Ramlibacter sp. AN1133]|uniref:Bug family tripartite tricarboxylate transporter substrate binding protein n=1 Tax=Ramlibacter sp. AN1133 TaxID=3133429 RepID=UPI0030BF04F3